MEFNHGPFSVCAGWHLSGRGGSVVPIGPAPAQKPLRKKRPIQPRVVFLTLIHILIETDGLYCDAYPNIKSEYFVGYWVELRCSMLFRPGKGKYSYSVPKATLVVNK